MELQVNPREKKKCVNKKLRREGEIPAIIYSQGKEGELVVVEGVAMKKVLQKIVPGTLPTTIFTLKSGNKARKAIVKDIQYNITTYDVIHLDFVELLDKVMVEVNVPIQMTGVMECAGVKQGGNLRQIIRYLKVRCLPKDIPTHFEIDVANLNMMQSLKLSDLTIPETLWPLVSLKEIVAVVSK